VAEIINLRRARKAKARDAAQRRADANRAKHGRTLAERRAADLEGARTERRLDGARREPTDD